MRNYFVFNDQYVWKIVPNFNGTATIYLKNGMNKTFTFINQNFESFETLVKADSLINSLGLL